MPKYAAILTFGDHDTRMAARPAHREYLKHLLDTGKLLESGPWADDTGALLIYEAADEAELRAIIAADPYTAAEGAIAETTVREWVRIFPE